MKLKRKKIILIALFILCILFSIVIINYLKFDESDNVVYKIAYISKSEKEDDLRFITEGIKQAAKDLNAEITIHTLSKEDNIESQIKLLNEEVENKVDSILISPVDYDKLSNVIEKVNYKIPVILMDSKIRSNEKFDYISCNNYELGRSLAEEVIQRGNTRRKIAIVEEDNNCSSLKEMDAGFCYELRSTKNILSNLTLEGSKESYYNQLIKFIKEENIDVIVTFDINVLEVVAKVKKDLQVDNNLDFEVYGASKNNKILSYIEEDIINGIVVYNEFNVGYLGVETAIKRLRNEKVYERKIDYSIVNKRNMYSEKNQKLLFPFVK